MTEQNNMIFCFLRNKFIMYSLTYIKLKYCNTNMYKRELTKEEILGLISEFRSEVKKNLAKIDFFNEKIEDLTVMLKNTVAVVSEEATAEGRKPRKKEEKPRKPYPLSAWDEIILGIIKGNDKPTLSKEIYEKAIAKAVETGIAMEDEEKMKAKINQCLVKLSSRRNDIMKLRYGGKGLAYCIANAKI